MDARHHSILVGVGRKLVRSLDRCLHLIQEYLSDINGCDGMVNASINSLRLKVHDSGRYLCLLLINVEVDEIHVEAHTATTTNERSHN